ncbi:pyrroline-5-carboxylate reductase [Larsenimonas suaedae]|uniref:Pyrroline-5-carboxylate reductase n=1 Tax=Larsenimonas suaedae TaxID=1851019 RepID=A0ABU1GY87_9GAMM|nr:pyrroline-5-carboxylate reductase [Larsenimonas suaedae]MCM2973611.1 pyrroline-5-carboxylate reductase [Larsenimonas suaedae]MDR5897019.1 pyrroline-5-carboxylate reductase [Larsenimonas suaedae]
MTTQKLSFIGAGNMASAIFGGLIDSGYPADHITATSPDQGQLDALKERYAINTTTDNAQAVRDADVVVLAIKPQIMKDVCAPLAEHLSHKPVIVSVAAGLKVDTLDHWLGGGHAIIRCMPNTPALVGEGASGLYANARVGAEQRETATRLLEAVGIVEWVEEESLLDAVTAVSGSGPAYFFLILEALEAAGVNRGLPLEIARRLAIQTAFGAAKMARDSDQDPAQLKRNVMSPKGTTEQAVFSFENAGIKAMFDDATRACAERASDMSDEFGSL